MTTVNVNGFEASSEELAAPAWLAAPEAERGVIAALLASPEVQDDYLSQLSTGLFASNGLYGLVFKAISDLRQAGRPADLVTVGERLRGKIGDDDMRRVEDLLLSDFLSDHELPSAVGVLQDRQARGELKRMLEGAEGSLAKRETRDTLAILQAGIDRIEHGLTGDHTPVLAPVTLYERLIVPMPELPNLGLVSEIAGLIGRQVGSPQSFNLLVALAVLAGAVNHRARLVMNFGDIRPNIYAALIAPSSVYHKTTTMSRGRDLMRRASLESYLLAPHFTSEGLLGELSEHPAGIIFRDEVGTLFGSGKVKYQVFLKHDLMGLYDCQPYGRTLRSGSYKVDNPYLNILGATTPQGFFENVSHGDWHDGFMLRWLVALPSEAPDMTGAGALYDETDHHLSFKLAGVLNEHSVRGARDFSISREAFDQWATRRQERLRSAYETGDDLALSMTERMSTYRLKVAMLLAIAGDSWGQIDDQHMTAAAQLVGHYESCLMTLRAVKQDYGVSGGKMHKVLRIINERGPAVTTKAILQYANLPKSEAEPVIDKLLEIGAIVETRSATGRVKAYNATTERLPIKVWS